MGKALEITSANFQEVVLNAKKPVLVDFWAEWCGPCRMVGPVVEEIANDFADRAVVGKLNVDEHQDIAVKYGIRSIPALLYFKNGEVADSVVGAVPKHQLASKLEEQIAS